MGSRLLLLPLLLLTLGPQSAVAAGDGFVNWETASRP
jgi:hypothetical protein